LNKNLNFVGILLLLQINNAGIGGKGVSLENAKLVLGTNYFAVKNVTKSLLPILRDTPNGARVIVVASRTGQFKVTKNACIFGINAQNHKKKIIP
jgi:carbonyl reductase 1